MKILVTGAKGFVAKNLISELINKGYTEIYQYTKENSDADLMNYTKDCDIVFHLAGVNRPQNPEEFMEGNYGFTDKLLKKLEENKNKCPILITSSIQAELDNDYGKSKKAGEELVFEYGKRNESKTYVYRLPNVFGKWCRPNYNSVIATFCHNIANNLEITVNDEQKELTLVYIDDVVKEFIRCLEDNPNKTNEYCEIPVIHTKKLGEIANLIKSFKDSRNNLLIPNMEDEFTKKLYSTYLSYLDETNFSYPVKMNVDDRGSFTELFKSVDRGQVSVNIAKPGITKGNHWHHTKNEKFVVVSGEGLIQFRKLNEEKIIEYKVSGEKIEVIDIPVGYTHNIKNIGTTDLITVMWCNELFDKENPDTYFMEV